MQKLSRKKELLLMADRIKGNGESLLVLIMEENEDQRHTHMFKNDDIRNLLITLLHEYDEDLRHRRIHSRWIKFFFSSGNKKEAETMIRKTEEYYTVQSNIIMKSSGPVTYKIQGAEVMSQEELQRCIQSKSQERVPSEWNVTKQSFQYDFEYTDAQAQITGLAPLREPREYIEDVIHIDGRGIWYRIPDVYAYLMLKERYHGDRLSTFLEENDRLCERLNQIIALKQAIYLFRHTKYSSDDLWLDMAKLKKELMKEVQQKYDYSFDEEFYNDFGHDE